MLGFHSLVLLARQEPLALKALKACRGHKVAKAQLAHRDPRDRQAPRDLLAPQALRARLEMEDTRGIWVLER